MKNQEFVRPLTKSTVPIRSLLAFQKHFPNEDACYEHLFKVKWPNGFVCPRCGHNKCYKIRTRRLYQCAKCRYQASITVGTVMERSHLPLHKWFLAIYLFATDKRGRSALSIARELEISYRAAWLMLHKIRHCMAERDFRYLLSGIVDLDDGFFGGEPKEKTGKKPRRGRGTKKARLVMGLSKSKDGKPLYAKVKVVPVLTGEEIAGFVLDHVDPEASLFTDAYKGNLGLGELVKEHTMKVYAKEPPEYLGWLHTVLGNFKTAIQGTYHHVSEKHLQAYFDEQAFRLNRRFRPEELFSRTLAACLDGPPITYAELTA